jgi:hypothetical protein
LYLLSGSFSDIIPYLDSRINKEVLFSPWPYEITLFKTLSPFSLINPVREQPEISFSNKGLVDYII